MAGSAPESTERREFADRIQMMIRKNNSMHLVLPDISDGDSQSPLDILRVSQNDLFANANLSNLTVKLQFT